MQPGDLTTCQTIRGHRPQTFYPSQPIRSINRGQVILTIRYQQVIITQRFRWGQRLMERTYLSPRPFLNRYLVLTRERRLLLLQVRSLPPHRDRYLNLDLYRCQYRIRYRSRNHHPATESETARITLTTQATEREPLCLPGSWISNNSGPMEQ
jgi:hypothetical protein